MDEIQNFEQQFGGLLNSFLSYFMADNEGEMLLFLV